MSTDDRERLRLSFDAPAEGYDSLIGRYLPTLGPTFLDAAGVTEASRPRVLDVGCGPGGLTSELVRRCGAGHVSAIDPSEPFVNACLQRNAGVDVRVGVAEALPFEDATFDAAVASLVVGFMTDPLAGAREMARVTRPGGTVAVCFWHAELMLAISTFWRAAAEALASTMAPEQGILGRREGDLTRLLDRAGLRDVEGGTIVAHAEYTDFDDFWRPFTLGIGPIGVYLAGLDEDQAQSIRSACRGLLGRPDGGFGLDATAWFARGTV